MSPTLKRKFLAAVPLGAVAIAAALLGGQDGLENRIHDPYRDVVGVLTVIPARILSPASTTPTQSAMHCLIPTS